MTALEVRSDSRQQQQSHSNMSPIATSRILTAINTPDNQPRTISLSHVSSMWREVYISCMTLFVEADWNEWPVWLLENNDIDAEEAL